MPSSQSPNITSTMRQGKLKFANTKRTATATGAKKVANVTRIQDTPQDTITEVKPVNIDIEEEEVETGNKDVDVEEEKVKAKELPELNIKDPRWRKLFAEARKKRNGLPLIHGEGQNNVHQILRIFDLNDDYGPCIGVTRLERWERAQVLGLNPPQEIRDILMTHEGVKETEYSECVFYDEV